MTYSSLRQDLASTLADFEREALRGAWHGKRYRDYWDWFDARSDAIEALAHDKAERYALQNLLLDVRDSAHEAYGIPGDRADDLIARN